MLTSRPLPPPPTVGVGVKMSPCQKPRSHKLRRPGWLLFGDDGKLEMSLRPSTKFARRNPCPGTIGASHPTSNAVIVDPPATVPLPVWPTMWNVLATLSLLSYVNVTGSNAVLPVCNVPDGGNPSVESTCR